MSPEAQKILTIYNSLEDKRPFTWLKGRSYSEAFVICVGAGPWKFARRKAIQGMALEKLAGKDIMDLGMVDWYPLEWQNNFVTNLSNNLQKAKHWTFEKFCINGIKNNKTIIFNYQLDAYCNCFNGSKVLSLFCRDALGVSAFPIDRHVRRFLAQNNLPTKEDKVIKLCFEAELEPSKVAVAFVRAASSMDNPDWSI